MMYISIYIHKYICIIMCILYAVLYMCIYTYILKIGWSKTEHEMVVPWALGLDLSIYNII